MKASQLIEELQKVIKEHGDIQVTCTHAAIEEDGDKVFETTVENLVVHPRSETIRGPWLKKLTEEEGEEKYCRLWL